MADLSSIVIEDVIFMEGLLRFRSRGGHILVKRDGGFNEFRSVMSMHGNEAVVTSLSITSRSTTLRLRFPDGFERQFITYPGGDVQTFLKTSLVCEKGRVYPAMLIDLGKSTGSILILDQGRILDSLHKSPDALQNNISRVWLFNQSPVLAKARLDAKEGCSPQVFFQESLEAWEKYSHELKDLFQLIKQKDVILFSQILTIPLCLPRAYEMIASFPQWNAFVPESIIQFLKQWEDKLMHIVVGFDASPVILIQFPYWEGQRHGSLKIPHKQDKEISPEVVHKWASDFITAFDSLDCSPDEIAYDVHSREIRCWWD